ncbi:MAG: flagellar motor protein MotB [Deltaproteobacteria bacterium]|jgi:chemotaxis protein MotB|nr:flagellar motor protein MotB [Deltaproteobacteria bacterium]
MDIYQSFSNDTEVEERVEWIYTYADMVTLLLCFFIIMFAASDPDKGKLKAISDAFNRIPNTMSPFSQTGTDSIMDWDNLTSQIVNEQITTREKVVALDRNGRRIRLSDAVQFDVGAAVPTRKSLPALKKLAAILHQYPGSIIVEGHTDNTPIENSHFSSNWALSSARAVSVAEILVSQGLPTSRIKIVALGANRPKVANEGRENQGINRRVDILVKR